MKYAFLSTLIPEHLQDPVRELSHNNMQDAANALQWHIYEGLCENYKKEITLFNVLPIGSFPQYYKKAFIKRESFETAGASNNVNIGFCNVKLIRKYHQSGRIYSELKRWCRQTDDAKTLFVYTVSAPFIDAVYKLKNQYPDIKVCAIVADLPDMSSLSVKKGLLQKIFEREQAASSYSHIGCIDCFALLTKHMADYMGIKKPFCVMEGISTSNTDYGSFDSVSDGLVRIMYSGTLHKRFGILNLVDAFSGIENEDYRLVICGIGDSTEEISRAAESDKRIEFYGQLPRNEVLRLQKTATVLVNPRQNNEAFTKYSFPSKNLEYLSSGTPLIAYKLDGIPDEYERYINYVEDDSVEALKNKIIDICRSGREEAAAKAAEAREFVSREKNPVVQTKKIIQMIEAVRI